MAILIEILESDDDYQIETKPSKSGKRTVYFPTIDGKRIGRTNYVRKWEARNFADAVIFKLSAATK